MKTHHFLILTLSIILLFCGDNKADRHKIVVAQIGSEEITLDDFEKSFLLNPQYATRTPVSLARTSQIHFLVQENYYYLAAKKIKLKEEKDLHKRLQYIRDQEILKAFINEEFLSKINISSANILDGLNKLNKEIRIINYFTADLESAIKLREILTVHNEEFYTKRNLTDNEKDKSTGTDLGWITFGMLDQSIEKAAYNLKEGDISKPVKSEYGYHIIKILKIRQNNDIQNMNLDLKKNRVETILKKRIAHLQIRDYITGLTQNEKIQINNRGLDFLISEIHKNVQPAYLDQNFIKPPIHNQELINIELKLSEKINNPLIRFGDTELTISNLLERLKEMPPFHRPYLGTRDRLVQSIIDMLRNDLLLKEAVIKGYDKNVEVKKEYNKYIKDYLSQEFKNRINSKFFQAEFPQKYQVYKNTLAQVEKENKAIIDESNLFYGITNPDSILTEAPIPVFLKNSYIW